ncbi:MAG TPA: hypothetical protein VD948_11270, partial [Rhodothermales bacterium]|nr:hypothetical protein [Rhodothermales bacterium]
MRASTYSRACLLLCFALACFAVPGGQAQPYLAAGNAHTCVLVVNGAVKCWGSGGNGRLGYGDAVTRGDGPGEMGNALPAVDLGTGRTATTLTLNNSFGHVCARLDNGAVKCWGSGTSGRLGYGDISDRGDGPGEMGDALPAVNLGTGRTATAVSAGSSHTCAVPDNGAVKCWGTGSSGQLGYGDTVTRGDGPGEMGDAL